MQINPTILKISPCAALRDALIGHALKIRAKIITSIPKINILNKDKADSPFETRNSLDNREATKDPDITPTTVRVGIVTTIDATPSTCSPDSWLIIAFIRSRAWQAIQKP